MSKTKARNTNVYSDIELNRNVSKPLQVAALKDGETAVYKLIMADFKDTSRKDDNDNAVNCRPGRSLFHTTKIYDPVLKKTIAIRNITSYKTVPTEAGGEKQVPVLERLMFSKGGVKTITEDQRDTYAWMERHPGNRDNPFRGKGSKKAFFYRVNPVKQAVKALENNFILTDALTHVSKANLVELKAIYESMSPTAKQTVNASREETLRLGVFEYAKVNPILAMKASDNKEVRLKIQIMEAEHFNIITFDEGDGEIEGNREWMFVDEEMTSICEVDVAVHKIDGLIEFFKNESGYKVYKLMVEKLDKVLNPAR